MKRLFRAVAVVAALSAPAFAADAPVVPNQAVEKVDAQRPTLEVVFVLDTTGSMGGLIEGAKEKIWSIASRMATGTPTPRIRVGLVAYRDRGDEYVTKRFDLTEDLDAVYANLRSFSAGGGGDGPEHVGRGLGEAVKLMSWSQEAKTSKTIFLVGDAPAHDDYQDGWGLSQWAKNAIAKGIVVNTVRCGSDDTTAKAFREVAKLADGSFVSIAQSGGMVAAATPYDEEMSKLSAGIASKTLVGGGAGARAAGEAEMKAIEAMPASAAADRSAFNAKTAPAAPLAAPKAAGAIHLNAAPAEVNTLREDELPVALRAVEKSKREAYVREQAKEQQVMQTALTELSKKRDAYLKERSKTRSDAFDDQVFESVKAQAATVGVKY